MGLAAAQIHAPTLHVRQVRLCVEEGPAAGREFRPGKDRIRIGNARIPAGRTQSGNDVGLDDKKIAQHHCELALTESGWRLTDLGSAQGTFVDGARVESAQLKPGARISLGDSTLVFLPIDAEIVVDADAQGEFGKLAGRSLAMRTVFGLLKKVAPMDVSVLITGETGTGKELVARGLHDASPRAQKPFVVLDCGSIPEPLIESELFGHEEGSFTGATSAREGAFERAHGGTIFLDEIGELRLDMQPRLLRVLEAREVRRVGGRNVIDVDVRVVAATNRDLAAEVRAGRFREDLFFRLNVIGVQLPALRARGVEDIALLAQHALTQLSTAAGKERKSFSPDALRALVAHDWPGNVRELKNVLRHALAFADGPAVELRHLPESFRGGAAKPVEPGAPLGYHEAKEQVLDAFERQYLSALLERCAGNVSRAARESGLHRKSIERLVKKYGLR